MKKKNYKEKNEEKNQKKNKREDTRKKKRGDFGSLRNARCSHINKRCFLNCCTEVGSF